MSFLVVVLLVFLLVAIVSSRSTRRRDAEAEQRRMVRVAIDLHLIRRRLDVAWTRTKIRRDGARLRRELSNRRRRP